jgi:hypothetical protein
MHKKKNEGTEKEGEVFPLGFAKKEEKREGAGVSGEGGCHAMACMPM